MIRLEEKQACSFWKGIHTHKGNICVSDEVIKQMKKYSPEHSTKLERWRLWRVLQIQTKRESERWILMCFVQFINSLYSVMKRIKEDFCLLLNLSSPKLLDVSLWNARSTKDFKSGDLESFNSDLWDFYFIWDTFQTAARATEITSAFQTCLWLLG